MVARRSIIRVFLLVLEVMRGAVRWLDAQTAHGILSFRIDIFCFDQGKPCVSVGPLGRNRFRAAGLKGFADKAIGPSRRRQPVAEQKPDRQRYHYYAYSPCLQKYGE